MSDHPSPATLYSMSWEGNYSPMYYKRVWLHSPDYDGSCLSGGF
jgi:hypothetical protein